MRLSFAASALALVAFSRLIDAASDLPLRWEALLVKANSSTPQTIADVSIDQATTLFEKLVLGRRSRSRWLYDIGEWQLHEGANVTQAQEFIYASASLGNANAQFLSGALSTQEDEATGNSLLHYHFASQGGSMAATMALGYRHLHGYDSAPKSCETALRHYKVVADDVMRHNQALPNPTLPIQVFSMPEPVRLSDDQTKLPHPDSHELQSVEYLRRRAMHSSNTELLVRTASLVLFSDLYQSGDLLDTLPAKQEARTLLMRAAELGSNVAKALLGHVHAYGLTGEEANVEEAILLYEDALNDTARDAFSGRSEAANGLGLIYLNGMGGHRVNIERAMSLFQLSAREGHADGVFNTAKVMGIVDPEKSTQYLEASADVGHVGAVFKLARMREKQRFRGLQDGVHSCEAIVKLYKQVAEHNEYGRDLLARAVDAVRNYRYDHALRLFLIAAEMGYEVAEHNAAWIMERYVVSSLREAAQDKTYTRLVKRGVNQRSADALVRAGDMDFALKNYRRAMVHYLNAADVDPNHPQAQFSLAFMLERGLGTVTGDRDLHRARWYYEQVELNEPLMRYVITFIKLKIDVEITLRAISEAANEAIGAMVKSIQGQDREEPSGVIVFGESIDLTSREPVALVPVMTFNGESSSVEVESHGLQTDEAITIDTWIWIDRSSSEAQTLLDWLGFVRVDLVRHQDGSSSQLRLSSAGESISVLTLTNAALPAKEWRRLKLTLDPFEKTVTLQGSDGAVDTGQLLLPREDHALVPQKISIGHRLDGVDGSGGGFVGKLWGFRIQAGVEARGDQSGGNEDDIVIDLQYDIMARVDESTGQEEETSRLVNRKGTTSVTAHDVKLSVVQTPRAKK